VGRGPRDLREVINRIGVMGWTTNNFYTVHATLSIENVVWGLGFSLEAMGMNEKD